MQRSAEGDSNWGGQSTANVGIAFHTKPVTVEGPYVNITYQADFQFSGSKEPGVTFSPSDRSFDVSSDGVDATLSESGITGLSANVPGVLGQRATTSGWQFYSLANAQIGPNYITTTVTETVTPSRTPPPEGAIVIAAASVGAVGVIVELLPRVACAFAGPLSGACTVLAPA
jgi:hypothetical protein